MQQHLDSVIYCELSSRWSYEIRAWLISCHKKNRRQPVCQLLSPDSTRRIATMSNSNSSTASQPKYRVLISQEWCKGCGICISFCPKNILAAEGLDQKVKVTDESLCINCTMCEVHCPDFAIQIVPSEANNER